MRKENLVILVLAFLAVLGTITIIYLKSNKTLLSPQDMSCEIDEDCTLCASSDVIGYAKCTDNRCEDARIVKCAPVQSRASAECIQPEEKPAYCLSQLR